MRWSREEDLLRITAILHFLPQITSPLGGRSWYLQFPPPPLPCRCYIPNLAEIGPVVIEEKMTTHDGRRQPIAIGHLSDSRYLKMFRWVCIYMSLQSRFLYYRRPVKYLDNLGESKLTLIGWNHLCNVELAYRIDYSPIGGMGDRTSEIIFSGVSHVCVFTSHLRIFKLMES